MRESTHGPRGIGQEVAAGGEVHALTREDVEECFVQQGGGTQRQGGKGAAPFSSRKAVQLAIQGAEKPLLGDRVACIGGSDKRVKRNMQRQLMQKMHSPSVDSRDESIDHSAKKWDDLEGRTDALPSHGRGQRSVAVGAPGMHGQERLLTRPSAAGLAAQQRTLRNAPRGFSRRRDWQPDGELPTIPCFFATCI